MSRAARWLTFAAAVSIVFSIAAFNILMGLALAALLFSGEKLRLPRIKLPLAMFMGLTVVAWVCSPDPWIDGYPQIRKFWVFCILLLVFSTLRSLKTVRWLFLAWAGLASISALRGFVQFAGKMHAARQSGIDAYTYYVSERITGFSSHLEYIFGSGNVCVGNAGGAIVVWRRNIQALGLGFVWGPDRKRSCT